MARLNARTRKPTFFWQGLLIVLPVLVLAVFGFISLREDKKLARSEAADRAQALADELLPQLWVALIGEEIRAAVSNDSPAYAAFQVDSAGQLSIPPAMSP